MKPKSVCTLLQNDNQTQARGKKRKIPVTFAYDKFFCTEGGNEFSKKKLYKNNDTVNRPNIKTNKSGIKFLKIK